MFQVMDVLIILVWDERTTANTGAEEEICLHEGEAIVKWSNENIKYVNCCQSGQFMLL